MELKPGSPEYKAEYDKEMQRLEAEAGKNADKKADKPAEIPSDQKVEAKADKNADAKIEIPEEVKKELAKLEKRVADAQRWGHENAAENKRLKKEAEERTRREALADDPLLKANPGLEDTIKRVAKPAGEPQSREEGMAAWRSTVARAIPDVEQLLGDQDFYAKAAAKKAEFGNDWDDPITAIRELSSIRTEHLSQKASQAAVEAARKDFEVKSKKRTAMDVPGGSGGKDAAGAKDDDAVKRYSTMSKAEFDKERSRVMGY